MDIEIRTVKIRALIKQDHRHKHLLHKNNTISSKSFPLIY